MGPISQNQRGLWRNHPHGLILLLVSTLMAQVVRVRCSEWKLKLKEVEKGATETPTDSTGVVLRAVLPKNYRTHKRTLLQAYGRQNLTRYWSINGYKRLNISVRH